MSLFGVRKAQKIFRVMQLFKDYSVVRLKFQVPLHVVLRIEFSFGVQFEELALFPNFFLLKFRKNTFQIPSIPPISMNKK